MTLLEESLLRVDEFSEGMDVKAYDNDQTQAFRVHRCELSLNAVNVALPVLANSVGSDSFYPGSSESSTMLRSRALIAVAFALLASGGIFTAARAEEQTLPAPIARWSAQREALNVGRGANEEAGG